ncbi:exonuclease SbcCD subunit D [Deinococcus yavapaiensis]|uniref:Nuclease SbcCD subunit D n=1 Tax=Deinococcus yavapaiensis KR-236 TaxID=694435 RepID=A0A318S5P2_9DEIO|nr:exonuclease SbcCD subunit D [Deinococcus yavapaiensis]PYE52925.1 exodeoxyribonuclease I subunit D [Deinococcus yavapaiensis KR-236]
MRLLHTADFHAGRVLRGADRTPEIRDALQEVTGLARTEKVDAVLVAGDLFDTVNPGADAEHAVFEFFLRLKELGIPSVAIAGNHDSANRLASLAGLLGWVGTQLVARPTPNPRDLVRTLTARDGTELVVGALPYLPERRIVQLADVMGADVGAWRQKYRSGMAFFLEQLEKSFRPNAVNTLMFHGTMDGARPSGSERDFQFDLSNAYTVSGQNVPQAAQYVALGHIHKPQQPSESVPAYYPGSLVQLDFGEAGEQKGVMIVEVEPGRPARPHFLELSSGKPLKVVRATPDNLEAKLARVQDFPGHLKVVVDVPGGAPLPGLKDRVLRLAPNALAVEVDKGDAGRESERAKREGLSLPQLFERYYRERKGVDLPETLLSAFEEANRAVVDEHADVEAVGT